MDVSAMDAFLAEQRERATRTGDPIEWQVLAETCLERVLLEAAPMGMAVGRPVFAKRPEIVDTLLADGLQAITEVRDLGRRHSEVGRIAAGLLANKIDGALAAMRYGRQVDAFLSEAEAFADGNPHIAVARGCRLLFAPRWLGGDPERALNLFESAAHALPEDERPLVFAAFAAHLQGDVARAQRSLRDAVACNPDNAYAREVLRRIQAGEADVFGRSLDG
ncbi:MAG: tetratricopeptide repeat protein [Planctomycetota bacterium]